MRKVAHDWVKMFQLSFISGEAASARGIPKLARNPRQATSTMAAATTQAYCEEDIITPALMVPARIARKVPISTSALPPTSSLSRRCWGRIEYLTGPNSAECVPMANSAASINSR